MIPGGILRWTTRSGDETDGFALPIRNRHGAVINLLRIGSDPRSDSTQEVLPGFPLSGGRVKFFGSADPADPTIFTDDWQEALLLSRRTGWTAVACLSLENLPTVVREWAEDHPQGELVICYNGTAKDTDNPELRAAYKVFHNRPSQEPAIPSHIVRRTPSPPSKSKVTQMKKGLTEHRAWLVPAGADESFSDIDSKLGEKGLLTHLANQRAAREPWPLREAHPDLKIVPLPVKWPAPVNGRTLLARLMAVMERYVALSESARLVTSVWVFMTYAVPAFRHLPLLGVTSPEYGCGKTTFFYLLQFLCRRALGARGTAFAVIARGHGSKTQQFDYEEKAETLLLDEAQTIFSNIGALERLEMSFDSYELGIVTAKQEKLVRLERRGATALAYREQAMPSRLASRCVHIDLQRQLPDEAPQGREELLTPEIQGELTLTRAMIRRWAEDHIEVLTTLEVPSLGWADQRADDVWRALLKIAFAIDRDTGNALLAAASEFALDDEAASRGRELLACVREVFVSTSSSRINSTELCDKLRENGEWPWKARDLDTNELARLLRPYGIRPDKPSRINGKTLRSYKHADIQHAWARYCGRALATGSPEAS